MSDILIVRHGEQRHRKLSRYMGRSLTHLRGQRPDLYRRLIFHHTGSPPPTLVGIGAVVFWLSYRLRDSHPACYQEAVRIAEEARKNSILQINPPWAVADLRKSRQACLWREAGVPTPEVECFETLESLKAAAGRLKFPLVLRGDLSHCQQGMRIVRDSDELFALGLADVPLPCAVSPFIDVRSGYRETAPKSVYARLFHKKRLIVANGVIRTKHIMFSANPIVGAKTSIFRKSERFRGFETPFLLWPLYRECVKHDLSYWQQEEEHRALMLKACSTLGLQVAAIDYSNLSDGTPILWEANVEFGIPKLRNIMLPRRRRAAERLVSYHEAIATFLSELQTATNASPAKALPRLRITAE